LHIPLAGIFAHGFPDKLPRVLPTPPDCSLRAVQRVSSGLLVDAEVPDQLEDFPKLIRELFNSLVKLLPPLKWQLFFSAVRCWGLVYKESLPVCGVSGIRIVIGGVAHGPRVFTGQIQKLPLNLCCHQSHQAASRVRHGVSQRPVQPDRGILGHVVCVVPPSDLGELPEKPTGEVPEPAVADLQNLHAG